MSDRKKFTRIIWTVVAVLVAVLCLGVYISYNHPVVNEFTLTSSKLDKPLTFVVLGDLHDNEFGEGNQELVV